MKSLFKSSVLGATCLLMLTTLTPVKAEEGDQKSFYFRAGFTSLEPDTSASSVSFDVDQLTVTQGGVTFTAAGVGASIAGPEVSASSSTFPSVRIGYRIPAYPNLAIETVLATANDITISLDESFNLGWVDIPDLQGDLAEITTLTPTASLVYSFDASEKFKPYLGLGMAFIMFTDAEIVNDTLLSESGGNPEMELSDAMGLVLQAGVDYSVYKNVWVSADIRLVSGAETDVGISDLDIDVEAEYTPPVLNDLLGGALSPIQGEANVTGATTKVSIDSTVLSLGVGMNF